MVCVTLAAEAFIERDGRRYAVRPDAVRLAAEDDGDYTGVVTACAFQGDRHELLVDIDGQTWRFFNDASLPIGAPVDLSIEPANLAAL